MKSLKNRFKTAVMSFSAPELINFEEAVMNIKENEDGTWLLEFLIYAKVRKIRDVKVSVGLLLSDWYCFEDELVYENPDVTRVDASVNLSKNGGFAFSVRGLSPFDEYYFRPYAIYYIGGKEVYIYGNIMNNKLLYEMHKPVFLPMFSAGPPKASPLAEWVQTNGWQNAGITAYRLEE